MHWPAQAPTWRAYWIGPSREQWEGPNVYFRARMRFERHTETRPFIIHIAAESSYRLSINGSYVGHGPARGTRTVNFFDSYDISATTQPGTNWIGVEISSPNVPTFRATPAVPSLFVQSDDGSIATDDSWEIQTCADWRRDVPKYNFQIGYMEWNDRRQEPVQWQTNQDNSDWTQASIVSEDFKIGEKKLLARDVPPLERRLRLPESVPVHAFTPAESEFDDTCVAKRMSVEPHTPHIIPPDSIKALLAGDQSLVIKPPSDNQGVTFIFDFRDSVNGWFELDLDGAAGTIVDIGYEEELINNRLNLTHFTYRFADRYILRDGRQKVGNQFTSRGFRYVQVVLRNIREPVHIHHVEAIDELYSYQDRGSFTCSDKTLNQIWEASVNTLRQCTTDTLVDCPWRENTLYFNDMLVEAVTSLQAFGDSRVIARCYRLAMSQLSSSNLLPAAVPAGVIVGMNHTTSIDRITLPSSNLLLPSMLEEYLLYTGDTELVNECQATVLGILRTITTWEDDAGLITSPKRYWNMIDWSYPMESLDGVCSSTLNWMYVIALSVVARLAEQFQWAVDSKSLRAKAERLAAAIDNRFWNRTENAYVEYFDATGKPALFSQLSAAAALLSGMTASDRAEALVAAMRRDNFLVPELFMHHFILRAFSNQLHATDALDRIRRYWAPIVQSGSKTIWEMGVQQHGKAAFEGAGSLCHGFSTTPIDFLQTVVLGVRPTKPGFAECLIAPTPFDLDHASGTVPTPRGNIDISWRRIKGTLQISVELPAGVRAVLSDGRALHAGNNMIDLKLKA